ncbi:hypothetical protein [Ruficoccus sp. ZRK36]|uniref:hypothetical protein n=1 Tax=Ruficoccus sp. ZRK36 TaxID=2866311 RepID=UPI001C72D162|nr:hypothetical protein [Ruficoccus sp. ZRK36]QYY36995.1 hypothetical protein K0V07_05820 [Ruficoccus sp. ZRK36]
MKCIVKLILSLSVAFVILGCSSVDDAGASSNAKTGFYTGNSHANDLLKKDTLALISTYVQANGCNDISHVDVKSLHYEPMNGQKGHVWAKEGWMITGCGKPYPFVVTYTEDGEGGSFIQIAQ